jgi:hypothetical protein
MLCVRYTRLGAAMNMKAQSTNNPPFRIVHHMKNRVSVATSMVFLLA